MAKLIETINLSSWPEPDFSPQSLFADIVENILGQQLSNRAADTIITRFKNLFGGRHPTPARLLKTPDEKIRACGTSWAKARYVKNVAAAAVDKTLDLENLPAAADEKIYTQLLKIKGIGRWTAEMFLMFTLRRPDIFSPGDAGLQNAVAKLYGVKRGDVKQMVRISGRWRPYRTLACRYLWKSLDAK